MAILDRPTMVSSLENFAFTVIVVHAANIRTTRLLRINDGTVLKVQFLPVAWFVINKGVQ